MLKIKAVTVFQSATVSVSLYSSGVHGDIFIPFGTKALTQNLKSLLRRRGLFFFVRWTVYEDH